MSAIRDVLGVSCLLLLWSRPVLAGPLEQMVDVAFGVGTGALSIVARYSEAGGGLLFGNMDSSRWRLQCGGAFLMPGESVGGGIVTLANGPLLVPTSRTVVSTNLDGCEFRRETLVPDSELIDVQADPSDPHKALAVVNAKEKGATTLLRRSTSGDWTVLGSVLSTAVSTGMRAGFRAGKVRIYQSLREAVPDHDAGARAATFKLRYTEDDARSFREHALDTEGFTRVIAVDPSNPERVVLLVEREGGGQSILVSGDSGASLRTYLDVELFGGITFAPNGQVWIGVSTDDPAQQGLWTAANLDTAPTPLELSNYTVQCLGYYPPSDTLYACQHHSLGVVDKSSGAYEPKVSLSDVSDFVRCEGAAAQCQAQLCQDYCGPAHFAAAPVCSAYDEADCGKPVAARERMSLGPSDAGVSSAPSAEPEDPKAPSSSGCGCAAVRGRAGTWSSWWMLAVWPLLRWRKRARGPELTPFEKELASRR